MNRRRKKSSLYKSLGKNELNKVFYTNDSYIDIDEFKTQNRSIINQNKELIDSLISDNKYDYRSQTSNISQKKHPSEFKKVKKKVRNSKIKIKKSKEQIPKIEKHLTNKDLKKRSLKQYQSVMEIKVDREFSFKTRWFVSVKINVFLKITVFGLYFSIE